MKQPFKPLFKFDLQQFADQFDTDAIFGEFIPDPSQVKADPVALGLEPPPEPRQEQRPDESDPNYWRGRYQEAERKISEQGNEVGQLRNTLNTLLVQGQEQQRQAAEAERQRQLAARQQQDARPAHQSDDEKWQSYMASFGGGDEGGNPVQQFGQPPNQGQGAAPQMVPIDKVADIARDIARQEISTTVTHINQDTAIGNELAAHFNQNDKDLHHVSQEVAELFVNANPNWTKQQRYQYAVGTARAWMQRGVLPPPPNAQGGRPVNHGQIPRSPQGGQQQRWQTREQRQAAELSQGQRVDDELLAGDLIKWKDWRIEQQERRKAQGA